MRVAFGRFNDLAGWSRPSRTGGRHPLEVLLLLQRCAIPRHRLLLFSQRAVSDADPPEEEAAIAVSLTLAIIVVVPVPAALGITVGEDDEVVNDEVTTPLLDVVVIDTRVQRGQAAASSPLSAVQFLPRRLTTAQLQIRGAATTVGGVGRLRPHQTELMQQ